MRIDVLVGWARLRLGLALLVRRGGGGWSRHAVRTQLVEETRESRR